MKAAKYLSYVLRHKWYVFVECCRMGIPVRGLTHDLSKFLPSEWFPYVESFYGKRTPEVREKFQEAWLRHQHRNPHHWQHWVTARREGSPLVLPMPDKYRRELLADWVGAAKAQGAAGPRDYYEKNKDSIILHPETRKWLEDQLWPA